MKCSLSIRSCQTPVEIQNRENKLFISKTQSEGFPLYMTEVIGSDKALAEMVPRLTVAVITLAFQGLKYLLYSHPTTKIT